MDRKQQIAYALASEEVGMREIKGPLHNDEIVEMFAEVGHPQIKDDETSWCAAFVGAMLERAGLPSTRNLAARSYLKWGKAVPLEQAKAGDIVVFWRESPQSWKGHVAFFVRHAGPFVEVLGGNQQDAVNVARYAKSKVLGVRRAETHTPAREAPTTKEPFNLIKFLLTLLKGKQ